MMLNALWNRRSGPGGGTRRLHHFIRRSNRRNGAYFYVREYSRTEPTVQMSYKTDSSKGDETGSTRVVKVGSASGIVPPLSGCNFKCER